MGLDRCLEFYNFPSSFTTSIQVGPTRRRALYEFQEYLELLLVSCFFLPFSKLPRQIKTGGNVNILTAVKVFMFLNRYFKSHSTEKHCEAVSMATSVNSGSHKQLASRLKQISAIKHLKKFFFRNVYLDD